MHSFCFKISECDKLVFAISNVGYICVVLLSARATVTLFGAHMVVLQQLLWETFVPLADLHCVVVLGQYVQFLFNT